MHTETIQARRPVRENLLTEDLDQLESVRLLASRCKSCNETSLGKNDICPNCGGEYITVLPMSAEGTLWTYTVVRHQPPGAYQGATNPFVPFGMGLVELPEGIRVLSPIDGDPEKLSIGMKLSFNPSVRTDDSGQEVVQFAFAPIQD